MSGSARPCTNNAHVCVHVYVLTRLMRSWGVRAGTPLDVRTRLQQCASPVAHRAANHRERHARAPFARAWSRARLLVCGRGCLLACHDRHAAASLRRIADAPGRGPPGCRVQSGHHQAPPERARREVHDHWHPLQDQQGPEMRRTKLHSDGFQELNLEQWTQALGDLSFHGAFWSENMQCV